MDERGLSRIPQETVSPLQMEALIRGSFEAAAKENAQVILPYHKRINGFPAAMSIRMAYDDEGEVSFSIDVGIFEPSGKLCSVGFVDVMEQFGALRRNRRTGVIQYEHYAKSLLEDGIERVKSTSGSEGIRVDESAREVKIGTSLITSARVLLDEMSIAELLIKDIRTGDSPGGHFYRNLGGRVLVDYIPATENTNEKIKTNMVLPTASAVEHPYVFS